jgi:hypothetical protein
MSGDTEKRGKRFTLPVLMSASAALGLVAAAALFNILGVAVAPHASAESGTGLTIRQSTATPTMTPTAPAPKTTDAPHVTPDPKADPGTSTQPKPNPTHTTKPTTPGGATGGGTKPTRCPDSRAEDPTVWDSCHAGYVAPRIVFAGIVACRPGKVANSWILTEKFAISGGRYAKVTWDSLSNNAGGTTDVTLTDTPVSGLTNPAQFGARASLNIWSMSGTGGIIDIVEFDEDQDFVLSNVCR